MAAGQTLSILTRKKCERLADCWQTRKKYWQRDSERLEVKGSRSMLQTRSGSSGLKHAPTQSARTGKVTRMCWQMQRSI
jgi:hypothetical protein